MDASYSTSGPPLTDSDAELTLQTSLGFDVEVFPIASSHLRGYLAAVADGFEHMAMSKVAIGGCARNLGRGFYATRQRLSALMTMFKSASLTVFENDSTDRTREQLDEWARRDYRVRIIGRDVGDPVNPTHRCPRRGTRMANYRNAVRSRILDEHADADYVIIVDMDLKGGWSVAGIANSFGNRKWDFVGSNGMMFRYGRWLHYDAWAFRKSGSFVAMAAPLVNDLRFHRGAPMVPVYSCFGGLGIYRMAAFSRAAYDGNDCEHVALHRRMLDNGFGRLYLNPSQIVAY